MKTLILLFSVLFTTMSFAQVPSYVPANGLVGYWPFSGNANDISGNGNNGTNNGATLIADRFGNANSAYNFDGINDLISIPDSNTLSITNNITMSAWVYVNSDNQNYHSILSKRLNGNWSYNLSLSYYFGPGGSPTEVNKVLSGRRNNSGAQLEYKFSNEPVVFGQWLHITVKIENNVITFYKNGIDMGVNLYGNQFTIPMINQAIGLTIGSNGDGGEWFNGKLDDIGIWNRALTDCEIQNLYTSTNPTNTTSETACDSYTWNGTTYTSSGVYTGTTTNCVTESLDLTITPSSTNTTTATACDSYLWNGTTYYASGVYTGTTTNCVTESLDLTITPSSTITQPASQSINISNNAQFIVGSSGSNAIYQWQTNLGFGFQNLNNAGQYNGTTSSTLSVTNLSMSNNNQVFRCIVSSGSCTDTSDVAVLTVVNNVGFNDLSTSKLSIYPNPTNGDFTITGLELLGTVSSLTLTDMNGKVVKVLDTKATKFSMASIKPGVYFLNIISGNKQEVLKIVKE